MHHRDRLLLAENGFDQRAAIKRTVLQRSQDTWRAAISTGYPATHAPEPSFQQPSFRRIEGLAFSLTVEEEAQPAILSIKQSGIIKDGRTPSISTTTRPVPAGEVSLERTRAPIHVVIAMPEPIDPEEIPARHVDPGRWHDRPPMMQGRRIQCDGMLNREGGPQPDLPHHSLGQEGLPRPRQKHFIERYLQTIIAKLHRTPADLQPLSAAIKGASPSFRHRPGMALRSIKSDVECNMIFRVFAPAPVIVGGEDGPDKGNDGQCELSAIADGVDIPPAIATCRNRRVEPISCISWSAASLPERALIGTPGPGCTLPPAR